MAVRPEVLAFALAGIGTLLALGVAVFQRVREKQIRSGRRRMRE